MRTRSLAFLLTCLMALLPVTVLAQNYSVIKAARSTMPIKTFSNPAKPEVTGRIELQTFNTWGAMPIVSEQGDFVQFRAPDGQLYWILSEKVEIARAIECGRATPESVVRYVKNESLANRGLDEACGKKGK